MTVNMIVKSHITQIDESNSTDENGSSSDDNQEETIRNNEADNESSEENENSDDESNAISNAGWADSISKILKTNKPKGKKTLVLSKAKKINDVKRDKAKPAGFEVETADGDVRQEEIEPKQEIEETKNEEPPRKKKRELQNLRVKPDILEKDRERTLAKIATKGVVHLFNAVKMQQKDINNKLKEAGPLEVRKEKVLKNIDKRTFLDVLMGEKSQDVSKTIVTAGKAKTKKESEKDSTWEVLRDDFMMSAKMKDWDKELEENDELEEEVNMESD